MQRYEIIKHFDSKSDEEIPSNYFVPANDDVRSFLKKFKRTLVESSNSRNHEIVGLLSFFSNHRIEIISKQLEKSMPVGTIFHVCPANVQSMVAYSLILSMMCGNSNIVKVSSRIDHIGRFLVSAIYDSMSAEMKKSNIFVSYDNSKKEITDFISERIDGRVIWGGDQTIRTIRKSEIPAHAIEVTFPTRKSSIIASSKFILESGNDDLDKIRKLLIQDISFADQAACTSPLSMFWIGRDAKDASKRLWMNTSLSRKSAIDSYEKLEELCRTFEGTSESSWTFMVNVPSDFRKILNDHPQNGLLIQVQLESMIDLDGLLDAKDQTLVCVDSKDDLAKFFNDKRSFCRFVDPGKSMVFDHVWDGHDIIERLSRKKR